MPPPEAQVKDQPQQQQEAPRPGGIDAFRDAFYGPPAAKTNDKRLTQEPEQDAAARHQLMLEIARHSNIPVLRDGDFDKKFADFLEHAKKKGFTEAQLKQTVEHLNRLVQPDAAKGALPVEARVALAYQFLQHAIDPTGIDQGTRETCAAAAVQARMFGLYPEQAARLIADVALTGTYKTTLSGRDVDMSPDINKTPEVDPLKQIGASRDYLSQLFQVTAMNVWLSPRNATYMQWPIAGQELIVDKTSGMPLIERPGGGLTVAQVADVAAEISGDKSLCVIHRKTDEKGGIEIKDVAQLRTLLEKMADGKGETRFPLIVGVHTGHPKFPNHFAGGWHAVAITGYDPKTGEISVDNFWGRKNDYFGAPEGNTKFTVQEMFDAMVETHSEKKMTAAEMAEAVAAFALIGVFAVGAATTARALFRLMRHGVNYASETLSPARQTPAVETESRSPFERIKLDEQTARKVLAELPREFTPADLASKVEEMISTTEQRAAAEPGSVEISELEQLKRLKEVCADPLRAQQAHDAFTRAQKAALPGSTVGSALVSDVPLRDIATPETTIRDGVADSTGGRYASLPPEYRRALQEETEKLQRELKGVQEKLKADPNNKQLEAERFATTAKLEGLLSVDTSPSMRAKVSEWIHANGKTLAKGAGAAALIVAIYAFLASKQTAPKEAKHADLKPGKP